MSGPIRLHIGNSKCDWLEAKCVNPIHKTIVHAEKLLLYILAIVQIEKNKKNENRSI